MHCVADQDVLFSSREQVLNSMKAKLNADQADLDLRWKFYNGVMEQWRLMQQAMGTFAQLPVDDQGGQEKRASLTAQIRRLLPHLTSPPSGSGTVHVEEVLMPPQEENQGISDLTVEAGKRRMTTETEDATADVELDAEAQPTRASKTRRKTSTRLAIKKRTRRTAAKEDTTGQQSEPGTPKKVKTGFRFCGSAFCVAATKV